MALFPASSMSENGISLSTYRNTTVTNAVSDGFAAKIGNIVIVNFYAYYNSATLGTTPCFTLPSGYRPSTATYGSCTFRDSSNVSHEGQCAIATNGNITYNSGETQVTRMAGVLVYEVA